MSHKNRYPRDKKREKEQHTDTTPREVKTNSLNVMPENEGRERKEEDRNANKETEEQARYAYFRERAVAGNITSAVWLAIYDFRSWVRESFPNASRLDILTLFLGIVIAISTFLYMVASFFTLNEIKKSSADTHALSETTSQARQDSRTFSMLQQRPYLVSKSGSTPAFVNIPISGTAAATVYFSNIGHIPAQSAMEYARLVHITFPPNQQSYNPFNEIDKTMADIRQHSHEGFVPRMDVAPGAEYIATKKLAAPLSEDDIRSLQDPHGNKGWLVFLGFATYTDTFGEQLDTEFCWMWFGPDPRVWHYCPTHNVIH